jgi:uncharacterized protein YkwD
MRRLTLTNLLLAAVTAGFGASVASAQDLDGTWLKLIVKGNGISIDLANDSARSNGVFKSTCYMYVAYDASSNTYTGATACEIAKGVWSETTNSPTLTRFSDEGGYSLNAYADYTNRLGQSIEGVGTHILTPTYNKRGVLTKVRLSSYGELHPNSTLEPGASYLMGGYTVVGLKVVERKVPDGAVSALAGASSPPPPPPGGGGIAADVLALVNANRAAGAICGSTNRPPVGPLSLDASLNDAAEGHALDMAVNNFFSHTGTGNTSPFQRIAAAGFTGSPQGENIAAGYDTAASVVSGWMTSPGHCNNIMSASYDYMGVGYAYNASSTYRHYWAQTFGGS